MKLGIVIRNWWRRYSTLKMLSMKEAGAMTRMRRSMPGANPSQPNPNKLNFIRRRDLGQEQKKSAKSVDAQGRRMVLHRLSNGNIPAYAAGPLKRERYVNPKMESELINFKKQVEKRFKRSAIKDYKFSLGDQVVSKKGISSNQHLLPLIHHDLSKDSDTKMATSVFGSLANSYQKYEGKLTVKLLENIISKDGLKTSRDTVCYNRNDKLIMGSLTVRENNQDLKPQYPDSQSGHITLKNKKRLYTKIQQLYSKSEHLGSSSARESTGNSKLYIKYNSKIPKLKKRKIIKDPSDVETQLSKKLGTAISSGQLPPKNINSSHASKKSQRGLELNNDSKTDFGYYKTSKKPSMEPNPSRSHLGKYKCRMNKATINYKNPNLTSVFKPKSHFTAEEFKKMTLEMKRSRKKSNSSLKYKVSNTSTDGNQKMFQKSCKLLQNYETRNYPQVFTSAQSDGGTTAKKSSRLYHTHRDGSKERKRHFKSYQLAKIKPARKASFRQLSINRN
ncbi:unnamed protein product [Moneuplotes crassus]|uniref:Uncharacterized protein n=1 Tax=Euplotes crassus TaxID=5936 RepID=A0AAD1U2K4_EUPCR|nr:unnamed protein product [Moneuplotes crassus]